LRRPVESAQYVSLAFGRAARQAGIAISMGSRGDAYDNAVAETFFATLKKELVNRRSWPSRLELQSAVFEYIEAFYNRQRRHSSSAWSPRLSTSRPRQRLDPGKSNNQLPKQPCVVRTGAGPLSRVLVSMNSGVPLLVLCDGDRRRPWR
jgi:putative transposase